MAISRTQAVSANATSVAITSCTAGDIILVWAYNGSAATAVTLAAGFTNIGNQTGTQQAIYLAYKKAVGGETSSGTWTNATNVVCMVYRGVDQTTPIGNVGTQTAGSSVSVSLTGITFVGNNATSWVVAFAAAKSATSGMASSPTAGVATPALGVRTNQTTVQGSDTGGPNTSGSTYSGTALPISPTSRWFGQMIELREAVAVVPLPELIQQPMTPRTWRK